MGRDTMLLNILVTNTRVNTFHQQDNGKCSLQAGFPLDLEILENLEKWEYTWKTWKYHGILKNLINIMEKWHETWKNLVATKNLPLTPLKQYKIH